MKRASRYGWTLFILTGGQFRHVRSGERDDIRGTFDTIRREIRATHGTDLHCTGEGVVMYDGQGQLRDAVPSYPRLDDGTRVRWPVLPPREGDAPEIRIARQPAAGGAA